jgi:glycosyltransferase involved in cell wall biosynthesis
LQGESQGRKIREDFSLLRIALVSTSAIPTVDPQVMRYGGIEALVYYELQQLQALGHSVTLFGAEGSKAANSEIVTGGTEFELNKIASEHEVDFDIIHQWSHIKPRSNATVQRKTCCSVFYTDEIGANPVFSCHQVANAVNCPASKVIYPGIDTHRYHVQEDRENWFLFFNRISSFKGTDIAIRIAKNLGIKLKIAGHDGYFASDPSYIEMIKQECDGEQIEYLGEQSFEEKIDLLSRAKALLFPFRWLESFSLITVESLLSGCPVICTSLGGPREIVENGISGYLCSSIDEFETAVKNAHLLNPKECVKRGSYFNSRRMTNEYLDYYREILT